MWITKGKFSIALLLTGLFSFLSLFAGSRVFAVSDADLLKNYEKMESALSIRSGWLYDDASRQIGWWIVESLAWVNDWIENVVRKIVTLNNFYESSQVQSFMNTVKPLAFGLFVIAVFVLGIQFMLNKIEKREEVMLNVLMAVAVLVIIPVLMTSMGKVINAGMDHMEGSTPSLSASVLKGNIVDLKYYAEQGFRTAGEDSNYAGNESTPPRPIDKSNSSIGTTDYQFANKLSNEKVRISINESLDLKENEKKGGYKEWGSDTISDLAEEVLKNKAIPTGNGEGQKVIKLNSNAITFTDLGRETYYRYHANFMIIIFTLIITAIALGITVIKLGRAIFDLAFHQIFGMFVAVTDLTGGQRTKKVIAEIANTFGVIFIMVFILNLFVLYANWVSGLSSSIGSVGVILMLIAGAWAVIDAPDIVQRLMGIDAGLRSGYGALLGTAAAVGLASKGAKMGKNVIGGTASKGAGLLGALKGGKEGFSGGNGGQPKMPESKGNFSGSGDQPHGGGGDDPPDGGGGNIPPNNPPSSGGSIPPNVPSSGKSRGSTGGSSGSATTSGEKSGQGSIPDNARNQNIKSNLASGELKGSDVKGGGSRNDQQGLVTGSGSFQRMNHSFNRGRSTGQFLGRNLFRAGTNFSIAKSNALGAMNRGVQNIGQTVGSKLSTSNTMGQVRSVGQSIQSSLAGLNGGGSQGLSLGGAGNTVQSVGQSLSGSALQTQPSPTKGVQQMSGQKFDQSGIKVQQPQQSTGNKMQTVVQSVGRSTSVNVPKASPSVTHSEGSTVQNVRQSNSEVIGSSHNESAQGTVGKIDKSTRGNTNSNVKGAGQSKNVHE